MMRRDASRLGKRLINAAKSPETKPIRQCPESQRALRVSRRALRLTLSRWSRAPRSDLDRVRRALEAAGVEFIDGGGPGVRSRKPPKEKPRN
jgi:hypothetical protein